MPPSVKTTRERITAAAAGICRREGIDAVNARAIARELGTSTQPIFSNFSGMEEVLSEVKRTALDKYFEYVRLETERAVYPPYKSSGMAYIRFAKEERELFKFLFMCDRKGEERKPTVDFEASVEMIMKANGIGRDQAEMMHLEMWACVHGIATMVATSFFEPDWELISRICSDVYHGVRVRHIEEEKNESN